MKTATINDIAKELEISRNTVSKVLNNKKVPESTRKKVLDKAVELGYKGMNFVSEDSRYLRNQRILLLTSKTLFNLNFFLSIVRGIESTVKKYDFELLQYTFNASTEYKDLSSYVKAINVDGIICIETFEVKFIKELLAQEVPVVFIDFTASTLDIKGAYDVVIMENLNVVTELCSNIIKQHNIKSFGFVGDYKHCKGFYERFLGMKAALFLNNLDYNHQYSITYDDSFPYGNSSILKEELIRMNILPECFVCANDSIAISLLNALKDLKIKVPEEIEVIGFDNIAESRISTPPLTTINTDKEYLGRQALNTLLYRIRHLNERTRFVYTDTNIVYRQSTKQLKIRTK